jgi:hypothetical protein
MWFPMLETKALLAPRLADPVGLQEHHSQRQFCIGATVAIAAAHWILQQ